MTPSECRPGTVVMVHGEYTAAIVSVDTTTHSEPWALLSNGVAHPLSHLTLAPRYYLDRKWQTERPHNGVPWTWAQIGHDGTNWRWLKGRPTSSNRWQSASDPFAARQAVEQACGVERTE
jgi:hypothetical protein